MVFQNAFRILEKRKLYPVRYIAKTIPSMTKKERFFISLYNKEIKSLAAQRGGKNNLSV
jgi:hypothetical protein